MSQIPTSIAQALANRAGPASDYMGPHLCADCERIYHAEDDGEQADPGTWLCWSCLDESRALASQDALDRRLDDQRRR